MNVSTIACAVGLVVCLTASPVLGAPCDTLAALALKDTTITSAQLVAAGQFVPPQPQQGRANAFKDLP